MANDEEGREPEDLGQDPFVERMRPDPSQPPEAVRVLEGLMGDSDREGYRRLYFTRELDYYAEFRAEDVIFSEPIPSDQSPFLGLDATRLGIKRDATIEFTRARTPRPVDEFDLDIRLATEIGRLSAPQALDSFSCFGTCVGGGCGEHTEAGPTCRPTICNTCDTCRRTQCEQDTCQTCQTCPGQATCQTCQTCPGQATCQTCPGQNTCQTCLGQDTCRHELTDFPTCNNTRCFTCAPRCEIP
jgi:hypothetical protein